MTKDFSSVETCYCLTWKRLAVEVVQALVLVLREIAIADLSPSPVNLSIRVRWVIAGVLVVPRDGDQMLITDASWNTEEDLWFQYRCVQNFTREGMDAVDITTR